MTGRILLDLRPPPFEGMAPYAIKGSVSVVDVLRCRDAGMTKGGAAETLGCSAETINRISRIGDVKWPRGRKPLGIKDGSSVMSRMAPRAAAEITARGMPAVTNPAFVEDRTIYPSTRTDPLSALNVLVSGHNSWKIGSVVTKGRWKGYPVFTLTLEERATCPRSCAHWRSCYGNHMRFAKRLIHGAGLEVRLASDLLKLQHRHPDGFVVRLHVLGDFYSVKYVELWRTFLDRFPALNAFGFSARWQREDPIAVALIGLVAERWDRFAIRFSNAPIDECATVSIEHPVQKPADAVVCPQQLGKTAACATCGLCWHSRRRIAFLRH